MLRLWAREVEEALPPWPSLRRTTRPLLYAVDPFGLRGIQGGKFECSDLVEADITVEKRRFGKSTSV